MSPLDWVQEYIRLGIIAPEPDTKKEDAEKNHEVDSSK